MKKINFTILGLFAVMAMFLTACPYSSSVPLSQPNVKVDPSIYGKWVKIEDYNDFPKYLVFKQIDGKKFTIEQYEYSSSDSIYSVSGTYVSHLTQIGDITFANMLQDGTYYFYKLEFTSADQLSLFEVTDNIDEVFNSSSDLYAFFDANKYLSFFYNTDEEEYKYMSEE